MVDAEILEKLEAIFGRENVLRGEDVLREKSLDLWPANLFASENKRLLPLAVVKPTRTKITLQLCALVQLARLAEPKLKIIARGGGSGVCGAANCSGGEIVVDMSGMRSVTILRQPEGKENGLAHLEPGASGEDIDRVLKTRNPRFTLKHYPASYYVSTAGGWIQTDASGHYGRVSGLVECVKGVDGNGRSVFLEGKDLERVLGMEGTTLLITDIWMPVFKLPPCDGFLSLRFNYLEDVADFLNYLHGAREDLERKLGVEILTARFYDWIDYHFVAKPYKGGSFRPEWYKRLNYAKEKLGCRLSGLAGAIWGFLERREIVPWTGVLYFVSDSEEKLRSARLVLEEEARRRGGESLGPTIAQSWHRYRFKLDYENIRGRFRAGLVADTFECVPSWDALFATYEEVREAIFKYGLGGAHLVLDRDGPYFYFSFAMRSGGRKKYDRAWTDILHACIRSGARTNHHHGIGKLKAGIFSSLAQFAYGSEWHAKARQFKREMDPDNVLNPDNLFGV